jgi:hypothetical protein
MTDWRLNPEEEPDPEIRAEGVVVGVLVCLAYFYGAYLAISLTLN